MAQSSEVRMYSLDLPGNFEGRSTTNADSSPNAGDNNRPETRFAPVVRLYLKSHTTIRFTSSLIDGSESDF